MQLRLDDRRRVDVPLNPLVVPAAVNICEYCRAVGGRWVIVLYVVAMVAVVVGSDIMFFRNTFWARLIGNVGIVMVFAAFYLRFQVALGGK